MHLELMRCYAASDVDDPAQGPRAARRAVPLHRAQDRRAGAVIAAFVSEYFGGLQNGLGSRIVEQRRASNNAEAWAYVLGACLLGLVFYLAAASLERLAMPGGVGARSAIGHDVGSHAGSWGDRPGGRGPT